MALVADGTSMFACPHRFTPVGIIFKCVDCGHEREEMFPVDQKKSLLFFPSSLYEQSEPCADERSAASGR